MDDVDLGHLWGAIVDGIKLDLPAHTVQMDIRVVSGGDTRQHALRWESVSRFEFIEALGEPWNYAEATEIHVQTRGPSEIETRFVLWDEPSGLLVRSRTLTIDGMSPEMWADVVQAQSAAEKDVQDS